MNRLEKIRSRLNNLLRKGQERWRAFAQKRPRRARWVKRLSIAGLICFTPLFVLYLAVMLASPSVRSLRNVQTQHASEIYSSEGVLLGRYFRENRTVVDYSEIPGHVIQALVATEDERFYQHHGVDLRSYARVLIRTVLMGDESGGGGSTLSQQLAKNLFPRKRFWTFTILVNKLREIVIARRLEKAFEKEEILALYLNTVPFPENVYGIDVASRRFFGKAPAELTVEEGALLIGTLQATTSYNPVRNPERALARRNVVLSQMLKNEYLDQSASDSLQALPIELCYDPGFHNQGSASYFREFVRQEAEAQLAGLTKANGEPYDLYTDGLRIYTTLDLNLQRLAEEAVQRHMDHLQNTFDAHWRGMKPWGDDNLIREAMRQSARFQALRQKGMPEAAIERHFVEILVPMTLFTWEGEKTVEMSPWDSLCYYYAMLQVGFMAMEPNTGYIRAWVGGNDFDYFQFDHVRARRQVGSVFKPVVYLQALRQGIEPCEQLPNELIVYHEYAKGDWIRKEYGKDDPDPHIGPDGKDLDDWIPQNSDGLYGGSYSMEGALTNSVNTITVSMIMKTGPGPVRELAQKMGVRESEIPLEPSIALGSAEISLYEMTNVFATLASRGREIFPIAIQRIETADGQVLKEFSQPSEEQVVDTTYADILTKMLETVSTMGTASRLRWKYGLYNYAIAGKTGTSQNQADGWFIGYTPNLVAGVWVGGDSPIIRFRNFQNGQGANTALPIWAYFMEKAYKHPNYATWQTSAFAKLPAEVSQKLACPLRIKSAEELLADSLAQDSLLRLEGEGQLPPELPEEDPPQGI